MTARERLLGIQRTLMAVLAARAALVGAAVAVGGGALLSLVGVTLPAALLIAIALLAAVPLLPAASRARSLERVALWVEEGESGLHYLVVALSAEHAGAGVTAQADARSWGGTVRARLLRLLQWPALVLAAAILLALLAHSLPTRARIAASRTTLPGPRTATVRDPLARLHVTVTPPAYAGRATTELDEPTSVAGLVASLVTVRGDGDATAVAALVDSTARPVARHAGGWTVRLAMPARPALLRLRAGGRERLVVLAPVVDGAPAVTLLLPARDSVLRVAHGTVTLRAQLRDDIGFGDARFELVVSRGQEENFTFRSTVLGARSLPGRAEATLDARLSLDSLALEPGDVLQLRAVARDGNTATGPGIGSSETRSLRIARAGEYDSVSVDPAPPGDPAAEMLSQRMLITLTAALDRRRATLPRASLLAESGRIAADQGRLRRKVGDIVFQRLGGEPLSEESSVDRPHAGRTPAELLAAAEEATRNAASTALDVEGDETPILAVSKPLLEAFNAMWEAGRSLEIGETSRALPPMRRALAAIERARRAERVYLRGRPGAVVVDVSKVRLAGKDHGASATMPPRLALDPPQRRRAEAFAHATALLGRDAAAAADTLLVMRVEALGDDVALATVLDDAARAARRGDMAAVGQLWPRLRRLLGGAARPADAAALWSAAP